MSYLRSLGLLALSISMFAAPGFADCDGVGALTDGSESVRGGGVAAARTGDTEDCGGAVAGGSSNVRINGRPAATVGDSTACGGTIISGNSNVLINGKPMATSGSVVVGCADGE